MSCVLRRAVFNINVDTIRHGCVFVNTPLRHQLRHWFVTAQLAALLANRVCVDRVLCYVNASRAVRHSFYGSQCVRVYECVHHKAAAPTLCHVVETLALSSGGQ